MELERLSKHMLRAFNREQGRGGWQFDGKAFQTNFACRINGIRFWAHFVHNAECLCITVHVDMALDQRVNDGTEDTCVFYGDHRFEQGFEWLADIALTRSEKLQKDIMDASDLYSRYERAAVRAARKIGKETT